MDDINKKEILRAWNVYFPTLKPVGNNKLLKIVGPVLYGFELIFVNNMRWYKPHIVIYSLLGNRFGKDIKSVFASPVLNYIFRDDKNLDISVSYADHNKLLEGIMDYNYLNSVIPFNEDVKLEAFRNLIYKHPSYSNYSSITINHANLLHLDFLLSMYIENNNAIDEIINKIILSSKKWKMELFESVYGNFDLWIYKLKEYSSYRSEYIQTIEENKNNKKLIKLNFSELEI